MVGSLEKVLLQMFSW